MLNSKSNYTYGQASCQPEKSKSVGKIFNELFTKFRCNFAILKCSRRHLCLSLTVGHYIPLFRTFHAKQIIMSDALKQNASSEYTGQGVSICPLESKCYLCFFLLFIKTVSVPAVARSNNPAAHVNSPSFSPVFVM